MKMFKPQLLIFLFILVRDSWCIVDALYDIAKEGRRFYALLDQADLHSIIGPIEDHENSANLLLRNQIHQIHEQLNGMEYFVNLDVINSWFTVMKSRSMAIISLEIMQLFIAQIHDNYGKFNDYVTEGQLEKLTESIFPNIESDIIMIRKLMTDPKELLLHDKNLIAAIVYSTETEDNQMCHTSQLIAEILIQIFKIVMIAEIETYVMLGFANRYQYAENKGWDEMNSLANSKFQTYFASYVDILREYLGIVDHSYLRACDPDNGTWILNVNCYELSGLPRAIIFRHHLAGCLFRTCDVTGFEKSSECHAEYYEERDECPSRLIDCIKLGPTKTCVWKKKPHRLQYVNSTRLGLLGKYFECPSETGLIMDDRMDVNNEYYSCSCDCYETHSKISLLIMESRMDLNKIITGLRFVRKNEILFIQVKEGSLEANGYVNDTTNEWSPIPNEIDPSQILPIDKENRQFFLDDLHLPPGYVLTGIKFARLTRGAVIGFAIELFGVPFNYATGELTGRHKMSSYVEIDEPGMPLKFKPINPVETLLPNVPSSRNQKYVQLQRSLLTEDFGQSTLPFFDGVPVITDPPSALNGVGIFHKGVDGYAGFISLRLYGIIYEKYFNEFTSAHIVEGVVILN